MTRRTLGVAVVCAAIGSAAIPAAASAATTVKITSKASFVPNRYIKDELRFNRDVYSVKSGGKVTIDNRSREPHTLSIVKKADFPKTVPGFDKCFEAGICGQLFGLHGFPENDGPPTTPLYNAGKDGFNTRTDSIVLDSKAKASINVTAAKGRKLLFMCIIHPWMQAKFSVK